MSFFGKNTAAPVDVGNQNMVAAENNVVTNSDSIESHGDGHGLDSPDRSNENGEDDVQVRQFVVMVILSYHLSV